MFDRFDAWLLAGLFLWIGLCILVNAVIVRCRRVKDLESEVRQLKKEVKTVTAERDAIKARDDAKRSHFVLIRDDEIEALRAEKKYWEKRYQILKAAVQQMRKWGEE